MHAQALAETLGRYRLSTGNEAVYQRALGQLLTHLGIGFEAECDLGPDHGRIDFYLPSTEVGIELKVQGSPSGVTAQLARYATSPKIRELVLLTGRARLGQLPARLCGKPLIVVATWRGGLHG